MTMMRNWEDLVEARTQAVVMHHEWKRRSQVSDLLIQQKWSTVWSDLTSQMDAPLVEDLYTEALEDKAYTAAGLNPQIIVAPSLGTKKDRGEQQAEKKRKVYSSYGQRSRFELNKTLFFMDWWKDAAGYGLPWSNELWVPNGAVRDPFFIRIDPRQVFPMAHNSKGELTAGLVARVRRIIDLENEWQTDIRSLVNTHNKALKPTDTVEELMWFDSDTWAFAVYERGYPAWTGQYRYLSPTFLNVPSNGPQTTGGWIIPPQPHRMSRCPLVEMKRARSDSEYWGGLDVLIPQLKVAHNIMARILRDIDMNIFSPRIWSGVENPEDWGPDADLYTDGSPNAGVEVVREPINFEANQLVQATLEGARRAGKYPQQRAGEPGASINSAKGTFAVQGSFNAEQATAQRDLAQFFQDILSVTAEFDEKWCGGSKQIMGFDKGQAYDERYDPRTMFNSMAEHKAGKPGDYRVLVTYGGGIGMDQASYQIQLATAMELKGMSRRTYMLLSNLVDDVIAEENEMLLEELADAFKAFMYQQALTGGNMDPMIKLKQRVDEQRATARQNVIDTIEDTFAVPAGPGGGGPGGDSPVDTIKQARSLSAGGRPSAEGQPGPAIGRELASILPARTRRALSETAPGGTSA